MPKRLFAGLGITCLAIAWGSCTPSKENLPRRDTVAEVLERHTDSLMKLPGVVGTAEGSCAGRPCILVLVERLTPSLQKMIPSVLDGVPVETRETGRIRANE
jgi:hypothetical protein